MQAWKALAKTDWNKNLIEHLTVMIRVTLLHECSRFREVLKLNAVKTLLCTCEVPIKLFIVQPVDTVTVL